MSKTTRREIPWTLAGVRPGRFDALLRAPTPRDVDDQDEPAEDSRPEHGLAFFNELKKELKA